MKWKKKIWVYDDIISKEHQEKIKDTLLGFNFPWNYNADITHSGTSEKRPGFSHTFLRDGVIYSDAEHIKIIEVLWKSCMKKINEKTNTVGKYSFPKARSFLQVPLRNISGGEYDSHHIDLNTDHFALLYYVCDSDGDTVIFENMFSRENQKEPKLHELKEKVRVTPKQGRVVIFDGFYWHTATQPTTGVRCVINTDVIQHM